MKKEKTVIIIAGPTASGKTDVSLRLAIHFNTSIISADSRQCFRELNIGVAKPPVEMLQSIKHYFINSHSIFDVVNAQVFENYALNAVNEIFVENDVAIMVGGTGLYIKAFCEGLDEIPEVENSIRQNIIQQFEENGMSWLQDEIKKNDPEFWVHAEQQNPQRLMRALEVFYATGKSINYFKKNTKLERSFNIIKLAINLPKEQLHKNIVNRVDKMIDEGLVEEVKLLHQYKTNTFLRTVGYQEIFEFLDDKVSLEQANKNIKTHTKQYAKRQITWFKKDDYKWQPSNSILPNLKDFNLDVEHQFFTKR